MQKIYSSIIIILTFFSCVEQTEYFNASLIDSINKYKVNTFSNVAIFSERTNSFEVNLKKQQNELTYNIVINKYGYYVKSMLKNFKVNKIEPLDSKAEEIIDTYIKLNRLGIKNINSIEEGNLLVFETYNNFVLLYSPTDFKFKNSFWKAQIKTYKYEKGFYWGKYKDFDKF